MTSYSEEAFRKRNKNNLIGISLNVQCKMEAYHAKGFKVLKLLNEKFAKLVANAAATKNVNLWLSYGLAYTKRQWCAKAQYSKKETIAIVGLSDSHKKEKFLFLMTMVTKIIF